MIGYFVQEDIDERGIRFGWSIHQIRKTASDGYEFVFHGGSNYSTAGYMKDVMKPRAIADAKRYAKRDGVPYLGVLSGGDPPK